MGNTIGVITGNFSEGSFFRRVLQASVRAGEPPAATADEDDDEFADPVERMLRKAGCLEKHYSVQECIGETKDWRQCQKQVSDFKKCMEKYKRSTSAPLVVEK